LGFIESYHGYGKLDKGMMMFGGAEILAVRLAVVGGGLC
jgi:hypothetical protein